MIEDHRHFIPAHTYLVQSGLAGIRQLFQIVVRKTLKPTKTALQGAAGKA